jgi:predicted DCC family thiol-disulfide oxidoreductase YuxK
MRVPNPPAIPLLVFDGDCGFCRAWIARWRHMTAERVAYEPYQKAAARYPTLPRARFRQAVQLILPNGEVSEGAEAVLRSLTLGPHSARYRRWLRLYQSHPGAAAAAEWCYRWIANHRPLLTRLTRLLCGPLPGADGELGLAAAAELAAARRRRIALAGGLGAALLLGGAAAAWRLRARRRC